MRSRRPLIAWAAVGVAAALATACSSSGSSNAGGPASSAPASAASSAPPASSASSAGGEGAPAGLGPQAAALQSLYDKAVAAGQTAVVLYGPSGGSDQKLYDAFQKDFPKIKPAGVPIVGPPMEAKLSAEESSGKHIADIAFTGSTGMLNYAKNGWFTPYTPITAPDAAGLAPQSAGPGNAFYGVLTTVSGVITNSNSNLPVPQRWSDLANSVYKDKVAMLDPTANGQMADIFAHLDLVPAYAKVETGLKANNVQVFPSTSLTGPLTAVAQGAKGVALAQSYAYYLNAKSSGAPVTFSLLKADNYYAVIYQGQVKGAPHPLAAQLFESWLFTPDGAAALASEGSYSTVLSEAGPQGLPALSSIPLQKSIPLDQVTTADNAAIVKAKQYWGG